MVCYAILFSSEGIATPAHVPDRVFGEWHILFNDAQSLMGRYYARGLIKDKGEGGGVNLKKLFYDVQISKI